MIETAKIKIRGTFQEGVLATLPADPNIRDTYVDSKAPTAELYEEELDDFEDDGYEEKGLTVFPRLDDGTPYLYDYQVKGFFKGTCGFLRKIKGSESAGIKAYKKTLDGLLYIYPRRIPLILSAPLQTCQRPLRASTMQGDRVALASSEEAPEGTTFEFTVEVEDKSLVKFVYEALDHAAKSGIGAWRNSGKGRFTYEVIEES